MSSDYPHRPGRSDSIAPADRCRPGHNRIAGRTVTPARHRSPSAGGRWPIGRGIRRCSFRRPVPRRGAEGARPAPRPVSVPGSAWHISCQCWNSVVPIGSIHHRRDGEDFFFSLCIVLFADRISITIDLNRPMSRCEFSGKATTYRSQPSERCRASIKDSYQRAV